MIKLKRIAHAITLIAVFFASQISSNLAAPTIVVIQSSGDAIYQQFSTSLRAILTAQTPASISTVTLTETSTPHQLSVPRNADIYITAGIRAAQLLSESRIDKPRILTLIPESFYQSDIQTNKLNCPQGNCNVIVLDQPIERQFKLIRTALPDKRRVMVIQQTLSQSLYSAHPRIAKQFGLELQQLSIGTEENLFLQLNTGIAHADVLLILPDPAVYNRNTARPILLTTYRYGVPVVAYSQSFVEAGAALGLFTTPEQYAKQCADLIADILRGKQHLLEHSTYPRYYTIGVNSAVSESLGIRLPSHRILYERLDAISP